jgi:hypothetical protein
VHRERRLMVHDVVGLSVGLQKLWGEGGHAWIIFTAWLS